MSAFDRAALERDETVQHAHLRLHRLGAGRAQADSDAAPNAAQIDLSKVVLDSGAKTAGEAVDYLLWRMLRVPAAKATATVRGVPDQELGTDSIDRAKTYMEDPLRMTVHLIMSTPEYQMV